MQQLAVATVSALYALHTLAIYNPGYGFGLYKALSRYMFVEQGCLKEVSSRLDDPSSSNGYSLRKVGMARVGYYFLTWVLN